MFISGWITELWRTIAAILIAVLLSLLTEEWLASFGAVSALLLFWHGFNLYRYEKWLLKGANTNREPVIFGIWREVLDNNNRISRKHQDGIDRLLDQISQLEKTISALPDSTVIMGEQSEIIWANSIAQRSLGIRYPGDRGVRLSNLVRDPVFIEFLKRDNQNESINIPSPVDEDSHLNIRVVSYGDNARLLTARDISELIRADAMRRDFVSNASHELKTPLTVMSGYMELLEGEVDEGLKGLVRSSGEQTKRMQQLVDDLLTLSRLDANHKANMEAVNVASMLEAIAQEARALSGDRGHQIVVNADASVLLEASHRDILSAFSNLVFNAVNHTPDASVVTISWRTEGRFAVLRVKDNGEGIPAHHLSRLTERFYRVQAGRERDTSSAKSGRGTGLGLAITKHVVQAHNGYMEIDSQVGEGSEFACFFTIRTN